MNKKMENALFRLMKLLFFRFISWLRSYIQKEYKHNPEFFKDFVKEEKITSSVSESFFSKIGSNTSNSIEVPDYILHSNGQVLNQGRTRHCVIYSAGEACNEGYAFHDIYKKVDIAKAVTEGRRLDPDIDKEGTYISNGPRAMKNLGYIDTYTILSTARDFDIALASGCTICTGTKKLDWRKTGNSHVAELGTGGGHAQHVVGRDANKIVTDSKGNTYKGVYIVENTWGPSWGDNGRYYVPFDLFYTFFHSKYCMIVDKNKTKQYIEKKKKQLEEKKQKELEKKQKELEEKNKNYLEEKAIVDLAISQGITNGKALKQLVIKQDVLFMIMKVKKDLENKIKKMSK